IFILFFFFSSRRRHTRSKRDWSSDVCSSDLPFLLKEGFEPRDLLFSLRHRPTQADELQLGFCQLVTGTPESRQFLILLQELSIRSEERRVGKECRSREGTEH